MSDRTPFHEQVRAALEADNPEQGRAQKDRGPSDQTQKDQAQKDQAQKRGPAAPKSSGRTGASGAQRAAKTGASSSRTGGGWGGSTARTTASSGAAKPAASKGSTRTARLRLIRLDPWSVMKTSFLLSIALGVVTVVSVAIVWSVLGAAGVWDSINNSIAQVVGESGTAFDVEDYLGTSRVLGFTVLVAVADVILLTAIATLGAFLYNLAAALLGGLEVTLAEDDR